jgi:hypothetical protein
VVAVIAQGVNGRSSAMMLVECADRTQRCSVKALGSVVFSLLIVPLG